MQGQINIKETIETVHTLNNEKCLTEELEKTTSSTIASTEIIENPPTDCFYFSVNSIVIFFSFLIGCTLMVCYLFAEERPNKIHIFPRDYTTNTARHYPEALIFRMGMTGSSFVLNFAFYLVFKWVEKKSKQIEYEGSTFQFLRWFAIVGFLCEFWTTASIDTQGNFKWHGISAFAFFLPTFPILGIITLTISFMRKKNPSFTSPFSYWAKVVICWFFIYENAFTFIGAFLKLPIKTTVIASMDEWFCLYGLIFWFWTFLEDWESLKVQFDVETFELKIVEEKMVAKEKPGKNEREKK